ncbi:MAG TPA: PEP-CTERM sorting domain-containing protein [Phycisphaerae bacterium]|nr:PEP-CTERM sorting domain-containing protein [Phycisphaerae bacterium]HRW53359.1 PEP-CTERM sorting domain-containing protein [Phycisphaerae bacterium]
MKLGIDKSNGFVVGAIAAVMFAATVAQAQPTLPMSLAIRNADAVPGFAGESWLATSSAFQNPGIDLSGNIGYLGELADSAAITSANDAGYWYGAFGSMTNQVQEAGPLAPNLTGAVGDTFVSRQATDVSMSPNGNMWIGGTIGGAGVTTANDQAIFVGQAGSIQKVYQEGDAVPLLVGTGSLQNPASSSSSLNYVNNAGQTIVSGSVIGAGAPASPQNGGLWVASSGGLGLIYQRNTPLAAFPGGEIINTGGASSMNGSGTALVAGGFAVGAGGVVNEDSGYIMTGDGSGALSLIARTNNPSGIAGIDYGVATVHPIFGATFPFTAARQGLNNGGRSVFGAVNLQGAAITAGVNDQALMTHSSGSTSIVAQTGDLAPGVGGDATLTNLASGFTNAFLNNNDQVAWLGTMAGTDVTTANDVGLWQSQVGGGDTLVVREGDAVPGLVDTFFGAPTNIIMNNLGQIVFTSSLTGGAVTSSDNWSIWMWDPTDGFFLAAREGNSYFGFTAGNPSYDTGANGEGGANALNDLGCLAMKVPGTSGEVALVTTCIPEPTTGLLLLAVGGVGLIRRRRA